MMAAGEKLRCSAPLTPAWPVSVPPLLGNHQRVARVLFQQRAQDAAQPRLGVETGVVVAGVQQVHALCQCMLDHVRGRLFRESAMPQKPEQPRPTGETARPVRPSVRRCCANGIRIQVQRRAQVVDERAERGQILAQRGQQRGPVMVASSSERHITQLRCLRSSMNSKSAGKPRGGRTSFSLSLEIEALAQARCVRGGLPAARVVEDEVAHTALGFRFRMPQAGTDEALARLQVHVERRRGYFTAALMEQARALPGLVR